MLISTTSRQQHYRRPLRTDRPLNLNERVSLCEMITLFPRVSIKSIVFVFVYEAFCLNFIKITTFNH